VCEGARNWGLWFGWKRRKEAGLIGYNDSDYAGDVNGGKSTTGVVFFLNNSPVTWTSMKQNVVVQSTCEAEYIATANAACQALWLARKAPMLKVDNKSTIALIKNPVLHGQSKHIEVKYHFVWECADNGQIKVDFIRSEEQLGTS
jgi:hypothetical protein